LNALGFIYKGGELLGAIALATRWHNAARRVAQARLHSSAARGVITLMQGLAHSVQQQDKVQQLVVAAREAGSATIAERVEDANTMAVLWQIGVGFMQGYLLNKPEEVVLG
jgi:hypothetical protein